MEAVLTQQLREPLEEQRLRADIPRLTGIEDQVSRLVQDQYEENPYPRWVRLAPDTPDNIVNFLSDKFPFARVRAPARPGDAGFPDRGLRHRPALHRHRRRNSATAHMLAVDLSLASLAYARRKSEELGLQIEYGQADILELGATGARSST